MQSSAQTVRIIVNADDFGRSEAINSAILDGIADGVITSTTLMASGPAFDSAVREARRFPGASFGVHLNLTQHRPLTRQVALDPLLDANGEFRREGVYEARWTPRLIDAVTAEWVAQVDRARAAGMTVSHLDSHHHVHTLPHLFIALKRVQRATGLRRVRGTVTIYDRQHEPPHALRMKKRLWLFALRRILPTRTPLEFADFLMFRRAVVEGSYAPRTWPANMELMVHPTGDVAESGEESAALRSGWMATLPVAAKLVPYHDL
jgi:predicted glycoside hydrolase/deacetylase ChbG (UPF0249 family)